MNILFYSFLWILLWYFWNFPVNKSPLVFRSFLLLFVPSGALHQFTHSASASLSYQNPSTSHFLLPHLKLCASLVFLSEIHSIFPMMAPEDCVIWPGRTELQHCFTWYLAGQGFEPVFLSPLCGGAQYCFHLLSRNHVNPCFENRILNLLIITSFHWKRDHKFKMEDRILHTYFFFKIYSILLTAKSKDHT